MRRYMNINRMFQLHYSGDINLVEKVVKKRKRKKLLAEKFEFSIMIIT